MRGAVVICIGGCMGAWFSFAAPVFAQVVTSTQDVVPTPVIFQMKDGRFYNPSSGLYAATRDDLLALLFPSSSSTSSSSATSSVIVIANPDASATTTEPAAPVHPLLAAVSRGHQMLEQTIVKKRSTVKDDDGWRDVSLAVWDKSTDDLVKVDLMKKGGVVKAVTPDTFKVRVTRSAMLNSAYAVNDPDKVVVAVRYPLYTEIYKGKKITGYNVEQTVYSPYSGDLDQPEIIENGKMFLQRTIDRAYSDLRKSAVPSRNVPGSLISDIVDPSMVKTVTAIEHVDQKTATRDPQKSLDVFFVTLGANEDSAYVYDRSSAGALGLVQFIPSTYNRLAKRPELTLNKDFERGMSDPENAIKAQVAYLDALMAELPAEQGSKLNEMAVAAYNGGESRVRKAANVWDRIFDGSLAAKKRQAQLEYDCAFANAEDAKQRMKKAGTASETAKWKDKLALYRKQYRSADAKIQSLSQTVLRTETVNYIIKYRSLLPYMQSLEQTARIEAAGKVG